MFEKFNVVVVSFAGKLVPIFKFNLKFKVTEVKKNLGKK